MTFCPNCGAEVQGRFCAKCGSQVEPSAAGSASSGPAGPVGTASMTDNVAGALCYLLGFITGILFLVLEPYSRNRTVRFHAFQSIFVSIALIILNFIVSSLTVFTFGLSLLLSMLLFLAGLLLWLFMMWKTYQNEKVVLPIVGPLAEKQA